MLRQGKHCILFLKDCTERLKTDSEAEIREIIEMLGQATLHILFLKDCYREIRERQTVKQRC
jgi:hypothetical protein